MTEKKTQYYLPALADKQKSCLIKGMQKEQCHNFITSLLFVPGDDYKNRHVLVCGTNAYSPKCEIRPVDNLDSSRTQFNSSFNAYNPEWNTTSLITSSRQFFYGGPLDLRGIDASITQQKISSSVEKTNKRIIRSAQYDSKWINVDANFVESFEYQDHVYFLFRESAMEYNNCGKRIFSRIGRVCKNDPGIGDNIWTRWTSFLKTRLNCSIPGSFPFYFDEIQSVDIVVNSAETPTIYAIFNTAE